jgi:vacuolar protein sorting-associated protein 35
MLGRSNSETGIKIYLEAALTADAFAVTTSAIAADFVPIAYEFVSQAYSLYEEAPTESKAQHRCISSMVGTLLALRSLSKEDYESLITKTAQFSAKVMKKPDQCQLVALCAHLFYPASLGDNMTYSNPQRALECLQRSLKLADACTSANPSNLGLFVDLLEHYVYFFEKKNPVIKSAYITGLIALIKEHVTNLSSFGGDSSAVSDSKAQFLEVVRYIKQKKTEGTTAEMFASIRVDNVGA